MITKSRLLLPLSALLVAALLAGLTWVISSRQPHSPAVLRLLGSGGAEARDMAAPALGTAQARSSGSGGYTLTGDLPAGQPADSPVYALGGPYDTSRLTRVLNKQGLTTEHASWWWSPGCAFAPKGTAPDQNPGAEPADGGSVDKPSPEPAPIATRDAAPPPSEEEKSVTVCGSAGGGVASSGDGSTSSGAASSGTVSATPASPQPGGDGGKGDPGDQPIAQPYPEPTEPAMSDAQARATAKPVFDAVDLPIADASINVTPYGASVWLNPIVGGLRTSGYTTRVEISRTREISWASGFLGDPDRGDSYPVISAQQAFDNLPAAVTDMMCPVGPDGKGCTPPAPPEITGAALGLQLRQTGKGEQLLVPAWLFTVKSWDEPLGQIAIPERFLGGPEPSGTAATKDSGLDQTDPGSEGSLPPEGKPTSVEPAPTSSPRG